MIRNRYSSTALVVVLIAALLVVFPADTLAQSRAGLLKKSKKAWNQVQVQCQKGVDVICAQAAILEADKICAESGKFYSRGSSAWQWISFALIMASAASTAVGASATVANAKIWSTLGGTTGIGAVTTNINANVTSDQAGLAAVAAAQDRFNTFVAANYSNYALLYEAAAGYASSCALAATAPTPAKQATGLSISTTSLLPGKVGTAYVPVSLAVTGGTAPYSWALTSGNLVGLGLNLTPGGVISGTPTTAVNTTPLTFQVTDTSSPTPQTATVSLTLTIAP